MPILVTAISGSLAGDPNLRKWLDVLARWPGGLALTPGRGPAGPCVQRMQKQMDLNDLAAHRMALLAMEQYGVAIAAVRPSPKLSETLQDIKSAIAARQIAVWMPSRMAMAATDIPASWDVGADTLAAWLAAQMSATHLLLVKSVDAPSPVSIAKLASAKIVDPLFPDFAARAHCPIWIAGPSALPSAREMISNGKIPGVRATMLSSLAGDLK